MNKVIQSFLEGKKCKQGNGQTDGQSLFLFGNMIAQHRADGLYVSNAGWPTRTTNKWLNMLTDVSVNMKRKEPYLNGEKWDGDFKRVNENQPPATYLNHAGEVFDMTCEYIRLDGWRGYSKPIYSIHCEPDTGQWDDSPFPNAASNLEAKISLLKRNKIPSRVVTLETSNVFCVNHFIVIPPKFYDEYIKSNRSEDSK
jgi:hypothetical protein